MPEEPLVIKRMREFKAALRAREASQGREMARRYVELERSVSALIESLANQVDAMRQRGEPVSESRLWQLRHYRKLFEQLQAEMRMYAAYAAGVTESGQQELGEAGIAQSTEAIQLTYLENGVLGATFDRLPLEAIEVIVGLAGNGQPIGDLFDLRMVRDAQGNPLPGVWDRLTQTLIASTALGRNPRETARLMRGDLTAGFNKALLIARSEQLRAYRMMSADNYAASGVVTGHRRVATHDSRTCAACIADEGTIYPVGVPVPDHPAGRCASVPVLRTFPDRPWLRGEGWLRTQPESVQQSILGAGKLAAWKDGSFAFKDLVTRKQNSVWGESIVPTPMNQLGGG